MQANEFWSQLDSLLEPKTVIAKEELDSTSSTDEFIEEISTHIAEFIRTNRHAFDTDDSEAVAEYLQVVQVPEVVEKIREKMVLSAAEPTEDKSAEVEQEVEMAEPAQSTDNGSDYVSQEVMDLLDA